MTRRAVENGFDRYVGETIDVVYEEFDLVRALSGDLPMGPGASIVNRAIKRNPVVRRRIIEPEIERYREAILDGFEAVVDYAEDSAGIDAYADRIMDENPFFRSVRSSVPAERRERIRERLLDQQRRLGDDMVPLLRSPEDEFWDAVRAELTAEEAVDLVEEHFAFTAPVREHREDFAFRTEVDLEEAVGGTGLLGPSLPTVRVEYTDEVLRSMRRAESVVIDRAKAEIDRRFDGA